MKFYTKKDAFGCKRIKIKFNLALSNNIHPIKSTIFKFLVFLDLKMAFSENAHFPLDDILLQRFFSVGMLSYGDIWHNY